MANIMLLALHGMGVLLTLLIAVPLSPVLLVLAGIGWIADKLGWKEALNDR
jgi:hypothetical protein